MTREEVINDEIVVAMEDSSQLSLHALEGTFNYQTIRLRRPVGNKRLCILIDLGSTHNFIDVEIITKLGCVMEPITELKVMVANGNELRCKKFVGVFLRPCKVKNFKLMD